jgi:hypothetical protein
MLLLPLALLLVCLKRQSNHAKNALAACGPDLDRFQHARRISRDFQRRGVALR